MITLFPHIITIRLLGELQEVSKTPSTILKKSSLPFSVHIKLMCYVLSENLHSPYLNVNFITISIID